MAQKEEWERRRQPRCALRKEAELRLADGRVVQGYTEDAGTGGVFFTPASSGSLTGSQGQEAILRLQSSYEEMEEMHCRVAHERSHGVGLQVDTRDGRFGVIVSSDLFMDLHRSVGIDVPDRTHLRVTVTLADGKAIAGRVKNLSRKHFMFHNALNPSSQLPVGEVVQAVLAGGQLEAVEASGVIRSHRLVPIPGSSRERTADYCTVEFQNLSPAMGERVHAWLAFLQKEEMWGAMKHRAAVHVSRTREETATTGKKSCTQLYQEFNKFFGFSDPS